VSGGYSNEAQASYSTVGGGNNRSIDDDYDWIAGDEYHAVE
jgi:hypothetical protein